MRRLPLRQIARGDDPMTKRDFNRAEKSTGELLDQFLQEQWRRQAKGTLQRRIQTLYSNPRCAEAAQSANN
jgi:hypothetical protein